MHMVRLYFVQGNVKYNGGIFIPPHILSMSMIPKMDVSSLPKIQQIIKSVQDLLSSTGDLFGSRIFLIVMMLYLKKISH